MDVAYCPECGAGSVFNGMTGDTPSWLCPACGHQWDAAALTAVPGKVLGGDVEGQADALADDADASAVFRGLSRAAESMAAAAAEMRRQEWFDLEDDAEPEAVAAWNGALAGLKSAASTFGWVADGWI